MYAEAVVTVVTTESDDISQVEMDLRIAAGKSIEHAVTNVYRLEFETEEALEVWLFANATREALNVEQLTA